MKASEIVLRDFEVNDHGCRYERYLEAGVWSVNYVWVVCGLAFQAQVIYQLMRPSVGEVG